MHQPNYERDTTSDDSSSGSSSDSESDSNTDTDRIQGEGCPRLGRGAFGREFQKHSNTKQTTHGLLNYESCATSEDSSSDSDSELRSDFDTDNDEVNCDFNRGRSGAAKLTQAKTPSTRTPIPSRVMDGKPAATTKSSQHIPADGGHVSERSAPAQEDPAASALPQKLWAVRTGWFPGMYYNYKEAEAQTFRHPGSEIKRVESVAAANDFLSIASDAHGRSKDADRIDRDGWTDFVQRTWHKKNAASDEDPKTDILPKLQSLFVAATDANGFEVNWARHPLPQELIQDERQHDNGHSTQGSSFGLQHTAIKQKSRQEVLIKPEILQPLPQAKICTCVGSDSMQGQREAICANPDCKTLRYHAACVGLGKRTPVEGWLCRDCRPRPPAPMTGEPELSPEQSEVVQRIIRGENVCYLGSAGTGKSTVLTASCEGPQGERQMRGHHCSFWYRCSCGRWADNSHVRGMDPRDL